MDKFIKGLNTFLS